ncbi:MAG: hypothetical protein ABI720_09335 [Actinomycetes bacterium]
MSGSENISATRQLLALLRLRWRMIRSQPIRWAITLLTILPTALVAAGLLGMQTLPDDQTFNLALATPTFYVGFLILAILAPLVSGGGYELYPSDQLVAYPIRPATAYRSTLVLAPVNLAWVINVIALFVVTGFAAGDLAWMPTARSLTTVAVFILAATVFGHTVGWLVMGFRQSRRGRLITNLAGVFAVLAGFWIFWTDQVITLLDNSPTTQILLGAYSGYNGEYSSWLVVVAVLVVAIAVFMRLGDAVAGWALRRPGDHADRTSSRSLPRRKWSRHVTYALLMVDHASVWRSTPLRRGVLVLVLVPGVISALAGMTWQSLVLVPGLIAAGAGLLFGINAFTLDSTGSVWLSTLPGWVSPAYLAKSLIFFEVALAAVLSALIGGSLRAQPPNATSEVTAAMMSALSCAVLVVALGMRSSLRHPHRADLKGPRDTPATPGVMAAQSMRFALVTTFTSLYFATLAFSGVWWIPLLGALPVLLLSALHWYRTGLAWAHPHVRASVVMTVSSG